MNILDSDIRPKSFIYNREYVIMFILKYSEPKVFGLGNVDSVVMA